MARLVGALSVLVALAGCGSRALAPRDAAGGAGGASAVTTDAGAEAAPDAACTDPRLPDLRICCGRPGEMPYVNCVDRSSLPPCSGEGEIADLKRYIVCCEGLSSISASRPVADPAPDAAVCDSPFELDPTRICARCGDGTCGTGENPCNCPQDCGEAH